MKFDVCEFLNSELGSAMIECVTILDACLGESGLENAYAVDLQFNRWQVFQMAVRQFYGITLHFTRTDDYFGICTADFTFIYREFR